MLNERQLKIVDLLEQQPRTPGELAQQTGVSGRTILRDIDYLNFTPICGAGKNTVHGWDARQV